MDAILDLRQQAPLFGLSQDASLLSDLMIVAYLLLIVPAMITGFIFARRHMFKPHHKYTMTTITITNWLIIIFVMRVSYNLYIVPGHTGTLIGDMFQDRQRGLASLHALPGAVAQLLATYLVIRMWFEKRLPQWVLVKNIKLYMRTTLALWLSTVVLGIGVYGVWYQSAPPFDPPVADFTVHVATPEVTPEVLPGTVTPEATVEATAEVTPEVTAEVTASATAVVTPEVTAEVEQTVEVTPIPIREQTAQLAGGTAEVTPEVTAEVTPEVTPEVTAEPRP